MPYVISTMGSSVIYAMYKKSAGGLPIIEKEVEIKGGTGVLNSVYATPNGVVTEVSDSELELLEANPLFKMHKDNGYIKVKKTSKNDTKDMEQKDSSAQLTEEDFTKKGRKAPKVSKK